MNMFIASEKFVQLWPKSEPNMLQQRLGCYCCFVIAMYRMVEWSEVSVLAEGLDLLDRQIDPGWIQILLSEETCYKPL